MFRRLLDEDVAEVHLHTIAVVDDLKSHCKVAETAPRLRQSCGNIPSWVEPGSASEKQQTPAGLIACAGRSECRRVTADLGNDIVEVAAEAVGPRLEQFLLAAADEVEARIDHRRDAWINFHRRSPGG